MRLHERLRLSAKPLHVVVTGQTPVTLDGAMAGVRFILSGWVTGVLESGDGFVVPLVCQFDVLDPAAIRAWVERFLAERPELVTTHARAVEFAEGASRQR
jgi:hypothetical protein